MRPSMKPILFALAVFGMLCAMYGVLPVLKSTLLLLAVFCVGLTLEKAGF